MPVLLRLPIVFVLLLPLITLFGCGEKSLVGANVSKLEESQRCIDCHGVASKITGERITVEWLRSGHNTKNGASCRDCHEPHQSHPDAGNCGRCHGGPTVIGPDVTVNADEAGKCGKCHTKSGGFKTSQGAHFNTRTDSMYPGSYVSSQYEKNCRKCHNPHDTASAGNHLKDWSVSSHGTVTGFSDVRIITRAEVDFKTAGTAKPASLAVIDTGNGNYEVCVRCDTTTGFIQYVSPDPSTGELFLNLRPFAGAGYPVKTMSTELAINPLADKSSISPDKSKELTNCNACHDNGSEVAYNYKLRNVPQVKTYYNFTSLYSSDPTKTVTMSGGKITNFYLKYPDVGASNMCVVCHSGRLTGIDIKMADIRNLDMSKTGKIVDHFRGAAQMVFRPTDKNNVVVGGGFEFYSSGSSISRYDNSSFTHDIIGTTRTNPVNISLEGSRGMIADGRKTSDGRVYGPCIGCHVNLKDDLVATHTQSSHSFLPVNRDASSTYYNSVVKPSEPISSTVSKACVACHPGQVAGNNEWDEAGQNYAIGTTEANALNVERTQYKAALKAFARLMKFAVDTSAIRTWEDAEGKPRTPTDWYTKVQSWLRSGKLNDNSDRPLLPVPGLDYYVPGANYTDAFNMSGQIRSTAYTLGAVYNYFMMYYDPGSFVHNRRYVKRLMYDSMDWLDDGVLNKSVCDPTSTQAYARSGASRSYMLLKNSWRTGDSGVADIFNYMTLTGTTDSGVSASLTADEYKMASYYICGSISTKYNSN
ncbi:MAG: cytochrome c3 family protein, partial [Desulfuromonadales bacterium]